MSKKSSPRKGDPGGQGQSNAFTLVPASDIGKVANGERSAIPALHLLAYKRSRREKFTLNVRDVLKRLRMGGDRFKAGIRHLKMVGVLDRMQVGRRSYAVERLAASNTDAFCVPIADFVIEKHRSEVTAFTLAANMSPTPRKTSEIASRIGIRSKATSRAVLEECCALGTVEQYIDESGAVRVCRPGGRPIEGGCQKSPHQIPPRQKSHHTEDREEGQSKGKSFRGPERDIFVPSGANDAVCREVDFLPLHDWWEAPALAPMIADAGVDCAFADDEAVAAVTAASIEAALASHGVAAPAHFLTPAGVEQFRDLVTAVGYYDPELTADELLVGICGALARHMLRGRVIRSLAIVAQPILKACHSDDWEWVTNYPSAKLGDKLKDWRCWAADTLLPALESAGVQHDETTLLSTRQLERLADLFRVHGQTAIEQACRTTTIEPGSRMIGWPYLLDCSALPLKRRMET